MRDRLKSNPHFDALTPAVDHAAVHGDPTGSGSSIVVVEEYGVPHHYELTLALNNNKTFSHKIDVSLTEGSELEVLMKYGSFHEVIAERVAAKKAGNNG